MIHTDYEDDGKRVLLEIRGHAGAGEKGHDLVCAAASILAWTLCERAEAVPAYHAQIGRNTEGACVEVVCRPEKEAVERCRELFETIAAGYRLLEREFGENVRAREVVSRGNSREASVVSREERLPLEGKA